jgi:hypothetical protein
LDTSNTDHGAYLAAFHGYTFHNDDAALNSSMNGFTYKEGDVIVVTVHSSTAKIHFEKEKQYNETLEMPYKRRSG